MQQCSNAAMQKCRNAAMYQCTNAGTAVTGAATHGRRRDGMDLLDDWWEVKHQALAVVGRRQVPTSNRLGFLPSDLDNANGMQPRRTK